MEENKMQKISLVLLVVLLISTNAFAEEEWISFTGKGESAPEYDIIYSTSSIVEFDVEITGMKSKSIDIYDRINIPEHTKMDSVGFPEVPVVSYLIAIPECNSVDLNVTVLDSIVIDNMNIYPAPEWVEVNNGEYSYLEEQFTINSTAYNTDAYFPGYAGELVEKGAVRAQHCIRVLIYTMQFNPVLQKITAYSRINISMTFNGASGLVNEDVGIFNEVCGASMINYISNGLNASVSCGAGRTIPGSVKWLTDLDSLFMGYEGVYCDYLIITNEIFWENPYIDSLAQKRANYNGFDVVIVKYLDIVTNITGYDNSEKIRNLIRDTYFDGHAEHTYDSKIGYVNLFGDAYFGDDPTDDCVPTHPYQNTPDTLGYDVYFSQLTELPNGDPDVCPDILLGRCSVDSEEQVENVCKKIIDYEPIPADSSWKDRMTFVNSDCESGANRGFEIILPLIEEYETTLLSYMYPNQNPPEGFDNFGYCYDPEEPHFESINNCYAGGNLIVCYMGHGSIDGWDLNHEIYGTNWEYEDIDSEDFNGRLPFITSMACNTGAFQDDDDCMAEKFLAYNSIRGAIGFIGATKGNGGGFSTFTPYLFQSAFQYGLCMCGEILLEAKLRTTNDPLRNCYNLYGDPALNILLDSNNIDKPDLVIIADDISYQPEKFIFGSPGQINFKIWNSTNIDISDPFDVSLFFGHPDSLGSYLVDMLYINGLGSYTLLDTSCRWNSIDKIPDCYELYIFLDYGDAIEERFDQNTLINNNIANKLITIYPQFREGFPISANKGSNIVTFDLNNSYTGKEIIIGEGIYSSDGQTLWEGNFSSAVYTSIGNIINNNEFQFIQSAFNDNELYISCFNKYGYTEWETFIGVSEGCRYTGPIIADLDNDGTEEIILLKITFSASGHSLTKELICLNSNDGSERWTYEIPETVTRPIFFTPIIPNIGNYNNKSIVIPENSGNIFIINEVENEPQLTNTISLDYGITEEGITCDLDRNGYLDILFPCVEGHIVKFCPESEIVVYYDVDNVSSNSKIILSDLNNDGQNEVIINYNTEIYILDSEFNQIGYINANLASNKIAVVDFDNNNENDIICLAYDELYNKLLIRIYNISGEEIYHTPCYTNPHSLWISYIENESILEIMFLSCDSILYVLEFPDVSNPVSWSGQSQRCNLHNSGVYEQPAYSTLPGDTVYWYNTILLQGEIEVPENSTLIIKPETKIKSAHNSKLVVYGTLLSEGIENHPIKFIPDIQGAPGNYWQGIEITSSGNASFANCTIENAEGVYLNNTTEEVNMNNVTFEGCKLHNESYTLFLNNSEFINSRIDQYGNKVYISETNFNSSMVYCYYSPGKIGEPDDVEINISDCSFSNYIGYPVYISGYDLYNLDGNTISGCNGGFYIFKSGHPKMCLISNNSIINNYGKGIFLYDSFADILGHNSIKENSVGIVGAQNCTITIIGNKDYQYQTIKDNICQEMVFDFTSFPKEREMYYNKIIDDDIGGSYDQYLISCANYTGDPRDLIVEDNYWGPASLDWTEWTGDDRFDPIDAFDYIPVWDPGTPRSPGGSTPEQLFAEADSLIGEEDYEQAKLVYKDIIELYPESDFTIYSMRNLLPLETVSGKDFSSLQAYYLTNPNCNYNPERTKLSEFLANHCNIKMKNYPDAISFFEDIILNHETELDSVYAVIDAGYTYMLMEDDSTKSYYVGNIPELKPKSVLEFEETRDKLLAKALSLPEQYEEEIFPETTFYLGQNYPNPMRSLTNISFSIPKDAKNSEIKIYNIRGQLVKNFHLTTNLSTTPPLTKVVWDGKDENGNQLTNGIYLYKLYAGRKSITKKMLLLR